MPSLTKAYKNLQKHIAKKNGHGTMLYMEKISIYKNGFMELTIGSDFLRQKHRR